MPQAQSEPSTWPGYHRALTKIGVSSQPADASTGLARWPTHPGVRRSEPGTVGRRQERITERCNQGFHIIRCVDGVSAARSLSDQHKTGKGRRRRESIMHLWKLAPSFTPGMGIRSGSHHPVDVPLPGLCQRPARRPTGSIEYWYAGA